MALYISSLNSGSNGNCYYVGNNEEAVLVDAGISCRETETRMHRLGLSMQKVKAIFVSHEHSDHIRGVPMLARKYNLPVYITPGTLQYCPFTLGPSYVQTFSAAAPLKIGALSITAFTKHHDAAEPHSFTISCDGVTVGVFTDIGTPCQGLTHHFKKCHAAFLEANYDEEMLDKGRYPHFLKNRIRGGKGHLSNRQALQLFVAEKPSYMSHLILAHLSSENNNPQLVHRLFNAQAGDTEIVVASRYKETAVYEVHGVTALPKSFGSIPATPNYPVQASLF